MKVIFYIFFFSIVLISDDISPFSQVIDLVEFRAEDDDDCYELQNILSDPHVMVSGEINMISSWFMPLWMVITWLNIQNYVGIPFTFFFRYNFVFIFSPET